MLHCSRKIMLKFKIMLIKSQPLHHSGFQKLMDFSSMHVCVFAPTFAGIVKRSRSDRTASLLPMFVLPGGTSFACCLLLLETLTIVHSTCMLVATPKCHHSCKTYAYNNVIHVPALCLMFDNYPKPKGKGLLLNILSLWC